MRGHGGRAAPARRAVRCAREPPPRSPRLAHAGRPDRARSARARPHTPPRPAAAAMAPPFSHRDVRPAVGQDERRVHAAQVGVGGHGWLVSKGGGFRRKVPNESAAARRAERRTRRRAAHTRSGRSRVSPLSLLMSGPRPGRARGPAPPPPADDPYAFRDDGAVDAGGSPGFITSLLVASGRSPPVRGWVWASRRTRGHRGRDRLGAAAVPRVDAKASKRRRGDPAPAPTPFFSSVGVGRQKVALRPPPPVCRRHQTESEQKRGAGGRGRGRGRRASPRVRDPPLDQRRAARACAGRRRRRRGRLIAAAAPRERGAAAPRARRAPSPRRHAAPREILCPVPRRPRATSRVGRDDPGDAVRAARGARAGRRRVGAAPPRAHWRAAPPTPPPAFTASPTVPHGHRGPSGRRGRRV
jgi:hypothetical protein